MRVPALASQANRRKALRRSTPYAAGVALAVALALVAAPATFADAITYTDGGNVWVASPDASVKKQLTTTATSATEGIRYFGPSQADNGRISVIFGGGLGKSSSPNIQVLDSTGKLQKTGLLQMQTCGAFGANPSAFGNTRMSPSGDAIAYDYICTNTGQAGGGTAGTEVYTAVTSGTSPGGAILEELRAARGYLPSWLPTKGGEFNDLLATDQYGRWLATLALSTPLEWTPVLEANEGYSFGGASFSRTGNVLVYQVGPEGSEESALVAARLNGTISPAAQITGQCVVATANGSMTPSVSPDGKRVAWSDAGGAKMATIEIPSSVTTSQCAGNTTTISPTGIDPVFSGAASPTNGGGGGGSSTGLSIKGPAKATLAQVRKGLTFTTRCSKKCTVKGTMTTGGKTVARATARLKRKGTAKVRLKARLASTVTEVTVVVSSAGKSATRTIPVSR